MAKEKNIEEVKAEVKVEAVSAKKAAFQALIEKYAKQNPVKYAQKKAALEQQLAAIK